MGAEKAAAWREPEVTRDCGWGVPLVRVSGGGSRKEGDTVVSEGGEMVWFRSPKPVKGRTGQLRNGINQRRWGGAMATVKAWTEQGGAGE